MSETEINKYSATFKNKEKEWNLEKSLIKRRYYSIALFHIIASISLLAYENDYKRAIGYVMLSPVFYLVSKIKPQRIIYTETSYNSLFLYIYIVVSVNFVMYTDIGGSIEFSSRKANILNAVLILVLSWMKYNIYYTMLFFLTTLMSLSYYFNILTAVGQLSALLVFIGSSYTVNIDERTKIQAENNSQHDQINLSNQRSFIAFLFHELRNPLNGIIGIIDIMGESGWTKELQHTLKKTTNHIMNVLDGTLELSKIESGQVDFKNKVFDMNDIINEAMDQQISVKPHLTKTVICPKNYKVNTDYTKLLQILINLLSNAIKFTDNGEIKIIIEEIDNNTNIIISDTGIGISENKIHEMFTKYKTFTDTKGSGLGLYLVNQYVKALKGTIKIKSTVGIGTKFTISLSLERVKYKEHVIDIINSNEQEQKQEQEPLLIIAVDDSPINLSILEFKFKKYKFVKFVKFENIESMFESEIDLGTVDIFIFDQHLGDENMLGTDGIKKVKEKVSPQIPVIYIASGNCTEQDAIDYINAGANGSIPKPYPKSLDYLLPKN